MQPPELGEEELPPSLEDPDEPFDVGQLLEAAGTPPTDFFPYNDLVRASLEFVQGRSDEEALLSAAYEVDTSLGQLLDEFNGELPFQESTPELEEAVDAIHSQFRWLREQLDRFNGAVHARDAEEIAFTLLAIRDSLLEVLKRFGQLRAGQPEARHSDSPYVNELCRVGYLVLGGKLDPEAFRQRLGGFHHFHEAFLEHLERVQPDPSESSHGVQEQLGNLRQALQRQTGALEQLIAYLENPEEATLESGLTELQGATSQMMLGHRSLASALQHSDAKTCLKCSHANPVHARFCEQCNFRFPEVVSDAVGTVSLSEGAPATRKLTENMELLVETANAFTQERIPKEEFLKTLDFLEDTRRKALQMLEAIPPAPEQTPEDQLELLDRAYATVQEGLEEIAEGIETLRTASHARPPMLDYGVEVVLSGGDKLLALGPLLTEAMALASGS